MTMICRVSSVVFLTCVRFPNAPVRFVFKGSFPAKASNPPKANAASSSAGRPRRSKKRFANMSLEKLMEKFLEQSMEAEENFYRLEEQRLQAEDKRREEEHSRELQMLRMLGQIFTGIGSTASSVPPPAPQPACTPQTNPAVSLSHPSVGNRNRPPALTEFASYSQPAGPGLLMEEGDVECSSKVIFNRQKFTFRLLRSQTRESFTAIISHGRALLY